MGQIFKELNREIVLETKLIGKVVDLFENFNDKKIPTTTMIVAGNPITIELNPLDKKAGYRLCLVNQKFDEAFAKDKNFFIGQGGTNNAIGNRYSNFEKFIDEVGKMEASTVSVREDGMVGFTNGRHRYAVLRDRGAESIPVAMDSTSIKNARKFGYINESNVIIQESLINLRTDVRRHLINNQRIPMRLAITLAQIFVVSDELEKELLKSTKYKDSVLKKKMEKIFQVASELSTKDDSPQPKLSDAINFIVDRLEGNQERIETIKTTFDRILQRMEASDAGLKLKIMKLTSLIMQSNDNIKKRREVIDQL